MAALLLERGARIDAQSEHHTTALRAALKNRQGEVVWLLLRHKLKKFLATLHCELPGNAGACNGQSAGR